MEISQLFSMKRAPKIKHKTDHISLSSSPKKVKTGYIFFGAQKKQE